MTARTPEQRHSPTALVQRILRIRRGATAALFAGAAILGAATTRAITQSPAGPLQAQAEAIVAKTGGDWSVMAWSLDRKETLFAVDADEIRVPASNNKVFSAIWALSVLGPDYRFPTDVLASAPIANGTLRGDLIIRGSGDPAFGFSDFDKDPMTSPRAMARALKAQGLRVVEGGVIADASVFDTTAFGPAWPTDTGQGASFYAPTVSGLPFQRNMIWINVSAGPGGIGFKREPDVPEIPVVSTARSGGGRGFAVRKPGEDTIRIKGGISGRGPHRYPVGAADPSLLAAGALRQALREEGVEVRGAVRAGRAAPSAKLVHRHLSIPLVKMIPKLNRDSDNFFAEHLWRAAAAKATGLGAPGTGGPASARFFNRVAQVPHGQLWQADGSGLSSENRASARSLVNALAYAHVQPWSQAFHESMAVGGNPEGTLRRLFNGGPAENNLHAKTGYIRSVRTLSGYVKTQNGETVMFSFLYNGRSTSGARGVQQDLGNLLAGFSR